ncbi:uncharacterized protein SCHCODRAFT_02630837 [Schizophyllum commune H4-8]|nr:uncharacterized protein SCHCODRAFT_02630837 [Schizophyllum commune H4-8]KAI5890093.1 hypothetical protein SCHCODRAFT_02630837 [Schizophyllum commune H4-8]
MNLLSLLQPARRMLGYMHSVKADLLAFARQLAASTRDSKAAKTFHETVHLLRTAYFDASTAVDTLADVIQPLSMCVVPEGDELTGWLWQIKDMYQYVINAWGDAIGAFNRAIEALGKLDQVIARSFTSSSPVRRALFKASLPVRCKLVKPSPRVSMLTTGRATVADLRLNVLALADVAQDVQTAAFEARSKFLLDVKDEKALKADTDQDERWTRLNNEIDSAIQELDGVSQDMKATASKVAQIAVAGRKRRCN